MFSRVYCHVMPIRRAPAGKWRLRMRSIAAAGGRVCASIAATYKKKARLSKSLAFFKKYKHFYLDI